jgi:hypothetical protein
VVGKDVVGLLLVGALGPLDGEELGIKLGSLLGLELGLELGTLEGSALGPLDGGELGIKLGSLLGLELGILVGEDVDCFVVGLLDDGLTVG